MPPTLSSKALFAAIPLLLLLYSFNAKALSASTANTIQGTAPYIEQNGIKATDLNSLLSIKIGTKTYISNAIGVMQEVGVDGTLTPVTIPLSLVNAGDTFSSVSTLVPADDTSYVLTNATVIPLPNRKDDDGDGSFTIAGSMRGIWRDNNDRRINALTDIPSICNAPYTLTLTTDSTTPSISTQYGDPKITTYGNNRSVFKINLNEQPKICFAKPDMSYGTNTGIYAGPTSMWDTTKGFITQSTDSAHYDTNFPTTGANGLYFELSVGGISRALTWTTVTASSVVGDITATPSACEWPSINCVKYTLTGPAATAAQIAPATPGNVLPVPTIPSTFELEGKDDSNTTVVKYGFVLQKWFINRGHTPKPATAPAASGGDNQTSWCASAGYHISRLNDITNAYGTTTTDEGVIVPFPTATPRSTTNNSTRRIIPALFSEWGYMSMYSGAGFTVQRYYVADVVWRSQFHVSSQGGDVNYSFPANKYEGICTLP